MGFEIKDEGGLITEDRGDLTIIVKKLKEHSREVKKKILEMGIEGQGGHLAPGLSCTDILVTLYDSILNFKPQYPNWEDRDRFILSKGHGCMPLYVLLAEKGCDRFFFTEKTSGISF